MGARVLVAEDDVNQAELVRRYLVHDGHTVAVVHDGLSALDRARGMRPDLLVLDLMLPEVDGLRVCRTLRAESDLAVLMLTARSTEDDLLTGLDSGADDYITKPYSPRELMARVRTLLRRVERTRRGGPAADASAVPAGAAGGADEERILRVGPVTVDPARHTVHVRGEPVECTPGEFRLLAVLAARPDRVFSRSRLLEAVHGIDRYITERTIDTHVKNLRRKLERDPRRPELLTTVYGVGYRLGPGPEAVGPGAEAGRAARG
ncbi:response regulator transcription factor [Nocardiopsis sp. RSe5-2]|uniref:Response regulator transcription factor n=1 Tax=Nocardiopsis endophytica TaxID=3018445 RepID=A0ABT4TWG0_9ACTN|nr:response regulator transcription factor [Nocardiopsis endophytica]MDA2809025.1 response regulator transcription factor [Nocardiopsis endophytica]